MLASPGGAVAIQVRLGTDGRLDYRVLSRDRPAVEWSGLGVVREDHVFDAPLTFITADEPATVKDRYTMIHGKSRDVRAEGRPAACYSPTRPVPSSRSTCGPTTTA